MLSLTESHGATTSSQWKHSHIIKHISLSSWSGDCSIRWAERSLRITCSTPWFLRSRWQTRCWRSIKLSIAGRILATPPSLWSPLPTMISKALICFERSNWMRSSTIWIASCTNNPCKSSSTKLRFALWAWLNTYCCCISICCVRQFRFCRGSVRKLFRIAGTGEPGGGSEGACGEGAAWEEGRGGATPWKEGEAAWWGGGGGGEGAVKHAIIKSRMLENNKSNELNYCFRSKSKKHPRKKKRNKKVFIKLSRS